MELPGALAAREAGEAAAVWVWAQGLREQSAQALHVTICKMLPQASLGLICPTAS